MPKKISNFFFSYLCRYIHPQLKSGKFLKKNCFFKNLGFFKEKFQVKNLKNPPLMLNHIILVKQYDLRNLRNSMYNSQKSKNWINSQSIFRFFVLYKVRLQDFFCQKKENFNFGSKILKNPQHNPWFSHGLQSSVS